MQKHQIVLAGNFAGTEPGQMGGEKLRVQQHETALPQGLHQMDQRDFRGVSDIGEHAFAEKGRAQANAIKSAGKFAVLPALDGMGVIAGMKCRVEMKDLVIDPCLGPVGGG